MIERLIAGHERARQFLIDLRILASTVVTIVRFRAGPVRTPDFPFRCRHCFARLRRVPGRWRDDIQLFADPNGHYACDGTIRTRHQSMPSIR